MCGGVSSQKRQEVGREEEEEEREWKDKRYKTPQTQGVEKLMRVLNGLTCVLEIVKSKRAF